MVFQCLVAQVIEITFNYSLFYVEQLRTFYLRIFASKIESIQNYFNCKHPEKTIVSRRKAGVDNGLDFNCYPHKQALLSIYLIIMNVLI